MTTDGFYRLREGELFYSPNSVGNLDYDLHRDLRHTYEYPVDGWRWFDSESDARAFYGMARLEAPEERTGPDYLSFYNAFLSSNLYSQTIIPALMQSGSDVLGNMMTVVAIALQDAMAGRVPLPQNGQPNSLQSAIWLLMSVIGPGLSQQDEEELQLLLSSHGLSTHYTLAPPQP